MGVFDRGWMELLQAGGMSYVRARRLTKRLCRVIGDCRAEIARARNQRQRQERQRRREETEREMNEAIERLHGRELESTVTLERLLESPWRTKVSYRRRREHVEREAAKEVERRRLEGERVRRRQEQRRRERKRRRLVQAGRVVAGKQTDIRGARGDGRWW